MIGAIPNPTKKVTIDFPINSVKDGILNLPKMFKKYRLEKQNPMFNQYTLDGSEFLSLGVYIDFNLTSVSENRTDLSIEIRRKLGAFDNWVEVQNANEHIQKIMDGLSKILTSPNGVIEEVKESSNWLNLVWWIIGISVLIGIFS
jgi:hypothetical protein